MDISAGIKSSLAGRYASALFDLASEAGTVTAVETDLEKLNEALKGSADLTALTTNPKISRADSASAMDKVGKKLKLNKLTQNFIGVLAQNRRLSALPGMIAAFQTIAAAQRGEVTANVTSAHALTKTQLDKLKDKLTAREGRTVKLNSTIDPNVLGGLVVTIGSQRIDGSIRTRLNTLANAMKG
ncbi:MAG: F0F1 ATP synthase subunit delta [Erythrobacter sp.]